MSKSSAAEHLRPFSRDDLPKRRKIFRLHLIKRIKRLFVFVLRLVPGPQRAKLRHHDRLGKTDILWPGASSPRDRYKY